MKKSADDILHNLLHKDTEDNDLSDVDFEEYERRLVIRAKADLRDLILARLPKEHMLTSTVSSRSRLMSVGYNTALSDARRMVEDIFKEPTK